MLINEIRSRAAEFGEQLAAVKANTDGPDWGWYPYRMLPDFIDVFDRLLTRENRLLLEQPTDRHMVDIGAADGDLGFFLQSIGFEMDIIDGNAVPATLLKGALGSPANIYEIDLDHDFALPRKYNLVFCLGVLYHLRNPMLLLETLARSTRYCILSTRIARYIPIKGIFGRRQRIDVRPVPVAYLLDPYEANPHDPTNYWVFSEASLSRAFARTGWTTLDFHITGDVDNAEPASELESRAWCLLESTFA